VIVQLPNLLIMMEQPAALRLGGTVARTRTAHKLLEAHRHYEKAFFSRANFVGSSRFGGCAIEHG
jgi:hypothetical protein